MVTLELTHNVKYGGYVVTITPTKPIRGDSEEVPGTDGDSTKKAQVPGAAVIVVVIDPQERPYAFSGGMSLTFLRSDVFVADPVDSGYEIVNDTSRRDAGTVGFATFVNVRVFNELQWFWPGIGIGVETGGNTQYYFGLGFRLQKGIFFNTGAVLGNVAVLPAGLEVSDSIADPNLLSNLDHRKKFSIFLGLSFTFLGGGQQAFSRPFAGGSDK